MAERDRLQVILGDRRYAIDLKAFRRGTVDMTRTAVDQQGEANDGTLSTTAAWKRTMENFTGGAGQVWADLPDTSERNRHRRSYGIEPFQYRSLQLAHNFVELDVDNDPTYPVKDVIVTGWGSVAYGPTGAAGADPLVLCGDTITLPWVHTTTTGTAMTGNVYDIATDGTDIYVVTSTNTYAVDSLGVSSLFSAVGGYAMLYAGGRLLIATSAGTLVELDNAGVASTILTHWSATALWLARGLVSTGQFIYAGLTVPYAESEIYVMTVEDATTALVPRMAVRMPEGEEILSMAAGSGFLLLGTNLGARLAVIESDGRLTLGPLFIGRANNPNIEPWVRGALAGQSVAVAGTKGYVLCEGDPMADLEIDAGANNVVCAVDLTRFVAELTPAWSVLAKTNDPATTPGRHVLVARGDTTTGGSSAGYPIEDCVIAINDEMRGIVNDERCATGEWWSGRYTYGTPEIKRFQSVELQVEQLPAGSVVTVAVISSAGEVEIGTVAATGRQSFPITPSIEADWLEVHLIFERGTDTSLSPEVSRITLRGVPVPDRVDEIYVPIIGTREVAVPELTRGSMTFDPWDEYQYLRGLMEAGDIIRFQMGDDAVPVVVQGLFYDGSDPNSRINGWTRKKDWIEGILIVKLETVPSVDLPADTSVDALLATETPESFTTEADVPMTEE